MFLILNRLRGTYSWFAKVNGVVLGLLVYFFTKELDIAIACALGYIIGESFGWGEWVGNITETRLNSVDKLEGEGKNNGIQYIAARLVPNWSVAYLKYCRVALVLRGLYWWTPTLIALCFITNPFLVISCVIVLALSFPLACELGYFISKRLSFKFLELNSGWAWQEVIYGLLQDIVLISLLVYI